MFSSTSDRRAEFLAYLNQCDSCELFYNYMKGEQLAYLLEFYLACDGLKNLSEQRKTQRTIIELIYKHYLASGKALSSRSVALPVDLLASIKQRLAKREFHAKFYEHAQDYVLKYMLQMCYPKFLIEQQNPRANKRRALDSSTFTPMHRRCVATKKRTVQDALTPQTNKHDRPSSMNNIFNRPEQPSPTIAKTQELAQRNPSAFFQEIKRRLLVHQSSTLEDESSAVLDLQIAQTIDDTDHCLQEHLIVHRPAPIAFATDDSGVETERNSQVTCASTDVIWYSSLESSHALLSRIAHRRQPLTFKDFRQVFQRHVACRYFFKTTCSANINSERYVYRELTMDDELVPLYDGKIFVRLDRLC